MLECKPTDIRVGFSTTNTLLSKLIRWVTGGRASHAWISFYDPCIQQRLVIQAESWGLELRRWSIWSKENILVSEFVPNGPDLTDSLIYLIDNYLNAKYDWKASLLLGVLNALKRWFSIKIKSRFTNPKKLMCAEAVIRFLQHTDYKSMKNIDPEITSPALLMKILQENKDEFSETV